MTPLLCPSSGTIRQQHSTGQTQQIPEESFQVRPAAAPRRGVRRPAVADEAKEDQEVRKVLADFSIAELSKLGHIFGPKKQCTTTRKLMS